MSDEQTFRQAAPGPAGTVPASRQDRLKQALRDNLKRRKSQARARATPESLPSDRSSAADDADPERSR